jgi:hypothetical protein
MVFNDLGLLFKILPPEERSVVLTTEVDNITDTDIKLYHKDIGFPKNIYIQERFVRLKYSPHALEASETDRYGKITLPQSLMIKRDEVIEIETEKNKLSKFVLRRPYNETHDLIIVLLLKSNKVKTVWLNAKSDIHQTLDETKYENIKK